MTGMKEPMIRRTTPRAIRGIGSAFTSLVQLSKARMSAAFFLEVIDHKDEMVTDHNKTAIG